LQQFYGKNDGYYNPGNANSLPDNNLGASENLGNLGFLYAFTVKEPQMDNNRVRVVEPQPEEKYEYPILFRLICDMQV
jgi:hypothetical protein